LTDELNWTTTWTRDAQHRVTRVDYPDGTYETMTYNSFGQVLDYRQRNGGTVHYGYDTRGLLSTYTDEANYVTTYTYNAQDLVATITNARNATWLLEYNERGQITKVTNPDSTFKTYAYDAYGNRTGFTDETNHTWTEAHDEFKRRVSSTDPLNHTTAYEYGDPGSSGGGCCGGSNGVGDLPTLITLPSGKATQIQYDLAWQKTAETVGYGTLEAATTTYGYDDAGNLTSVTNPLQKTSVFTYNSRNWLATAADPLNNTTSWTYDAVGNTLTTTWPDNTVTTNTYDAVNRLLTNTDPKNQTTALAYDDVARTATLTDARGKNTVFQFDARGKRTRKTYHDGSHEDWSYDEVGKPQTYTATGGQVATFTRNNRNRITLLDWSDATPDVSVTYDATGRLLTLNNANSALTYSYDAAGQPLSETQDLQSPVDLPAKTVSYSYDVDGNRDGLTYPSGTALSYSYTNRNQVKDISADGPPPLVTYAYDLAGRRTGKSLENETSTTYTYDDADRLLGIAHGNGTGTIQAFSYGLNAVGDRTYRTESGVSIPSNRGSYAYDAIDEITQVKYNHDPVADTSSRQVDYAYDAGGNRQTVTEDPDGSGSSGAVVTSYTANDLNQYTGVGAGLSVPTYDANGNTTHLATTLGVSAWNYSYDAENRLVSGSNGTGTITFSFAYDARRRCVARTINGTTTANFYDGWSLIEERSTSDALAAKYVQGVEADEILCTIGTSGTVYHHYDGLGSVTALTDSTGALVERFTYDVYGMPAILDASGTPLSSSAYGNRFLYTGREWFADLKLNDHRNRYYQPEIGRWLSRDPLREDGGLNLYEYVENDPIDETDPLGFSGKKKNSLPGSVGNVAKKIWNAPNSVVGAIVGGAGLLCGGSKPTLGNNAIQFPNNPLTSGGAITFGNVINYGPSLPPDSDSPESPGHTTGDHERQHTHQGELLGPLYIPAAGLSLICGKILDGDWHGRHSFMESGPQMDPPRPWPNSQPK
jgi:RHS repeat-associated protein